MSAPRRAPSLRREIVLGYTAVLVVALLLFTAAAALLLRGTLARAGHESLRQAALTAEQFLIPEGVPRAVVAEEPVPLPDEEVEALRRAVRLPTGEVLNVFVTRSLEPDRAALRAFVLIALALVPLTALVAALAGRSVADRILLPLHRLVGAVREVGIGDLSRRVEEPDRPREMGELAASFNEMMDRLQRAVEGLRSFTADASHEMRTPLTVIRGQAEVALAHDRPAEELRETLEEVVEETRGMLAMVEDLLALARGGEAAVPATPVDLFDLLAEVREVGEALAAERPVEVRLEAPAGLVVPGDAGALRRLFLNLVSNAVKFTERGHVAISARRLEGAAAPDGGGWVEVAVEDTGAGIAPEALERVWERFYRADAARGRGGTGLGLAIARMIVERHGGEVSAESEPGRGSTFRVRLPGG